MIHAARRLPSSRTLLAPATARPTAARGTARQPHRVHPAAVLHQDGRRGGRRPQSLLHLSRPRPHARTPSTTRTCSSPTPFPEPALTNPWTNLFEDRAARIAAISDADILAYIRDDNYLAPDGSIRLAATFSAIRRRAGTSTATAGGIGFVPDAYFRFDDDGYDLAPDGSRTGWRAFAYTPLPGSFSPASGSTDDVLIRLPEAYRQDADGKPDWTRLCDQPRDRRGADPPGRHRYRSGRGSALRGRSRQGRQASATADHVAFDWAPLEGRDMSYVGKRQAAPGRRRGAARRRSLPARHRVRPHRALCRRPTMPAAPSACRSGSRNCAT